MFDCEQSYQLSVSILILQTTHKIKYKTGFKLKQKSFKVPLLNKIMISKKCHIFQTMCC